MTSSIQSDDPQSPRFPTPAPEVPPDVWGRHPTGRRRRVRSPQDRRTGGPRVMDLTLPGREETQEDPRLLNPGPVTALWSGRVAAEGYLRIRSGPVLSPTPGHRPRTQTPVRRTEGWRREGKDDMLGPVQSLKRPRVSGVDILLVVRHPHSLVTLVPADRRGRATYLGPTDLGLRCNWTPDRRSWWSETLC